MSIGGGNHTHHHGLLAGVSAGAVAVIVVPLLAIWLAKGLIIQALGVAIWAFMAVVAAVTVAGVLLLYRWVWHKHVQFSAAAPARPVTAAVVPGAVESGTVRELAPAPVHLHLPEGMAPGEVAVLLAGLRAGEHPELGQEQQ